MSKKKCAIFRVFLSRFNQRKLFLFSCSFSTPITELAKKCSFENNLEIDDITVCLTEDVSKGMDKAVCKAVLASLVTNVRFPAGEGNSESC